MGAMARSKVGFISGKHYWEMIPTLVIGSGDVYIGIVNEKVTEFSIRVGFCHNSWAYYDSRGSKVHSGERKTYAEGFRQRDVIGVYLDVDNKSISFSKNGIDNKVAFNDLHGEVFYCAASCFCTGTEIQKVKKKNSKYSKVYLH